MTRSLYPVIAGMLSAGYLIVALFFLRYWSRTRDRLFIYFSLAFALLAVQRIASAIMFLWSESATWTYLVRLLAFTLILWAIVDKNRPAGNSASPGERY